MKTLKFSLMMLFTMIASFCFSSCGDDDDSVSSSIVGSWIEVTQNSNGEWVSSMDYPFTCIFKEKGIVIADGEQMTYTVKGNRITMYGLDDYDQPGSWVYYFSITDDIMHLWDDDGCNEYYKRISE